MSAEGSNKIFDVEATETVKRKYRVHAPDEKQARKRLHLHWNDPEMLRDGIVTQTGSEEVSNRQVSNVTEIKSRAEGPTLKT